MEPFYFNQAFVSLKSDACAFSFLTFVFLVIENTAQASATKTTALPYQAVCVTEPVWLNTMPPNPEPIEIPICKAELLKLC